MAKTNRKGKGGARPGAGRKPKKHKETYLGAVKATEEWFNAQVDDGDESVPRWMKFLRNMERLADGYWKSDEADEDGNERVYRVPPDRIANEYLLNRLLGKHVEKTELEADVKSNLELSDEQFQKLVLLAAERANSEKGSS